MPLTDVHNTLAMAAKPPQVHTDAAVSMAVCCRLSWHQRQNGASLGRRQPALLHPWRQTEHRHHLQLPEVGPGSVLGLLPR